MHSKLEKEISVLKTGRILLIIFLVLLLGAGITSFLLIRNLDKMATQAIEDAGDELLAAGVSLESAKVGILDGTLKLSGFVISNPDGFSSDTALRVGSVVLDVDLGSLGDEVIIVQHVEILNPQVTYEIDSNGVSNIDALQRSLAKKIPANRGGKQKLLIVERVDFRGGNIIASAASQPGLELVFDFPVVFMNDIGAPDGASAEEVGNVIAENLMSEINRAAKKAGVDQLVNAQKQRLRDRAEEKLKDLFKQDD